MKIKLEVEVTLHDWHKARKMSLREHLGEIEDKEAGVKFNINRSVGGLAFMVDQVGTRRQAIVDCSLLVKAMAEALMERGEEIDSEEAA